MNTYVSINITNFGMGSSLNQGYIYIASEDSKLEEGRKVTMEEALKEMAKLAKKLNKAPTFRCNYLNPTISYRELHGYLD
jgi:hypothetical protein